jgi:hypothetical protein
VLDRVAQVVENTQMNQDVESTEVASDVPHIPEINFDIAQIVDEIPDQRADDVLRSNLDCRHVPAPLGQLDRKVPLVRPQFQDCPAGETYPLLNRGDPEVDLCYLRSQLPRRPESSTIG